MEAIKKMTINDYMGLMTAMINIVGANDSKKYNHIELKQLYFMRYQLKGTPHITIAQIEEYLDLFIPKGLHVEAMELWSSGVIKPYNMEDDYTYGYANGGGGKRGYGLAMPTNEHQNELRIVVDFQRMRNACGVENCKKHIYCKYVNKIAHEKIDTSNWEPKPIDPPELANFPNRAYIEEFNEAFEKKVREDYQKLKQEDLECKAE